LFKTPCGNKKWLWKAVNNTKFIHNRLLKKVDKNKKEKKRNYSCSFDRICLFSDFLSKLKKLSTFPQI